MSFPLIGSGARQNCLKPTPGSSSQFVSWLCLPKRECIQTEPLAFAEVPQASEDMTKVVTLLPVSHHTRARANTNNKSRLRPWLRNPMQGTALPGSEPIKPVTLCAVQLITKSTVSLRERRVSTGKSRM